MKCVLELHKGIAFIDRDLSAGIAHEAVCERYNVSSTALELHVAECLNKPISQESVLSDINLVTRIVRKQLMDADRTSDKDAILKFGDRLLKISEVAGRATALFPKDGVTIDNRTVNVYQTLSEKLDAMSATEMRALSSSLDAVP